jgi:hypothetical protein
MVAHAAWNCDSHPCYDLSWLQRNGVYQQWQVTARGGEHLELGDKEEGQNSAGTYFRVATVLPPRIDSYRRFTAASGLKSFTP